MGWSWCCAGQTVVQFSGVTPNEHLNKRIGRSFHREWASANLGKPIQEKLEL